MTSYILNFRAIVLSLLLAGGASALSQTGDMLPAAYRNPVTADTTNIAQIPWNIFFEQQDLVALIGNALEKNNELQIAEKNIGIANLYYRQARLGNIPEIGAFANATSTRFSDNSLNGKNFSALLGTNHVEDFTAGLNLSWEADIWGKIKNRKKAALANYMATYEAKKALQTAVVANVATGFYDLLMLDAQLAIAKETLLLNDSIVFSVKLQYDAGNVTLLAVQQTEAQRLVALQLVPQIEQQIMLQENALSVLSGSFPQAQQRSSLLHSIEIRESIDQGIPVQLLSNRPDVKSAELAVQRARANMGVAKASLYPALTISASTGVNSFELNNWFNIPASLFGSVAGGLTAPIFQGKKLKTQYRVAVAEHEQEVLRFKQAVIAAVAEVSDALVKIDKQEKQYAIAVERAATLEKSITNASLLIKNGMASYIELITAQGNLLQAQLDLAGIKKERLASIIELYRALGGGWR